MQLLLQKTTLYMSEAALRSVLKGSAINAEIRRRQHATWLLPENATLFNLVELGKAWLDLVLVLVPLAESALGQFQFTFAPPSNPKEALRIAIEKVKSYADRLELLMYDPNMKDEDRQQTWRAQLTNLIGEHEFMQIVDVPHMDWEQLEKEFQEELFDKFMKKLRYDTQLFTNLHDRAVASGQKVAHLDDLLEAFFPSRRPALAAADFSMPTTTVWSVAKCIAEVRKKCPRMTNETAVHIEETLAVWQRDGLFEGAQEDELREALRECNASVTETRLIIKNLKDNNII